MTKKPATLLGTQGDTTFTVERPWHGRSGGGLIDVDARRLVGVVQGYEIGGRGRGVYISHAAILRFLEKVKRDRLLPLKLPMSTPRYDRALRIC